MPQRWITAAALVLAAVGGATAGTEPTGTSAVDPVLSAGFAIALTSVASRSHPAVLLVTATAAAATGDPLALALAAVAAALTLWQPAGPSAPLAAAALANALLHLGWPDRFGATAAIAAGLATVLLAGAWRRLPRRPVIGVLALLAGGAVLASAGLASTLAAEAGDLRRAVDLTDAALGAARSGESAAAAEGFAAANQLITETTQGLDRWWVQAALAVPVVAQHARAVEALTDTAAHLTSVGQAVAVAADPARLAVANGAIDISAIKALAPPLRQLDTLLVDLDRRFRPAHAPWVLDRLGEEVDELEQEAAENRGDVATALAAADAGPWLLGDGVERRYFLAVMNPAELRGGGGFVGNWGILTVTDGKLALPRFGRIAELYRDEPYEIDVNPEWNARYVDGWGVDVFPQNVLGSPHMPDNAEAIRQIAEQAGLGVIDGVIALDPFAIAGFLELSGPLEVGGWGEPLTKDNAAEILLHTQYLDADDPSRVELLERTTKALFERLTSTVLPAPSEVAQTLGPLVAAGHLQVTSFDGASSGFLARVGLERRLEPPIGDSIGLVTASAVGSKLDWFLRRSVTYVLRTDPDSGARSAAMEVTLANNTPVTIVDNGYFGDPVALNRQLVSIYTAFPQATGFVDGEAVDLGVATERGHRIYEVIVTIPPGGTTTVRVELAGDRQPTGVPQPLRLLHQPWVGNDDYRVVVDGRQRFAGPLVKTGRVTSR